MRYQLTIDGKPCDLEDGWSADAAVNWGCRSFQGTIPETVTWAEQEAPLVLWLEDGTPLWEGKLSLDPQPDRGKLGVKATGYAERIEGATTRMFYRIDGGEPWVEADADPHNYVFAGVQKFDLNSKRQQLAWKLGDGSTAYAISDRAGYLIWVEGGPITKYSITAEVSGNFADMNLQVLSGTGPSGSLNVEGTHSLALGAGGSATYVNAGLLDLDLLCIRTNVTAAFTPAQKQRVKVTGIMVYGRTVDDAFSASEVVADVGGVSGFDISRVQSHGMAILPLDWDDDHTTLLDYMADLCDWQWNVHGDALAFGPFETTWTGYLADGLVPTWENQPRANRVKVPFTYISGREGNRTAEPAVDPFPNREVVHTTEPIEDPQTTGDLADAYAAAQVEYWASRRVAGRVKIGRVFSSSREPSSGYKVREGQLLSIPERADLGPQRIVGVTYRAKEDVTVDLNEDFNVIRMLQTVRPKKGKRKRKKRRR